LACAVGIVSTHPVCCQCPRHLNDFCKTRSTGPASKRPRAYRLRRRAHFGHLTCERLQAPREGVLASVDTERHDVCMRRRRGFSFLCRGGPCHLTDFALKSAENDARFATRVAASQGSFWECYEWAFAGVFTCHVRRGNIGQTRSSLTATRKKTKKRAEKASFLVRSGLG
jgi:hypothetical protein